MLRQRGGKNVGQSVSGMLLEEFEVFDFLIVVFRSHHLVPADAYAIEEGTLTVVRRWHGCIRRKILCFVLDIERKWVLCRIELGEDETDGLAVEYIDQNRLLCFIVNKTVSFLLVRLFFLGKIAFWPPNFDISYS